MVVRLVTIRMGFVTYCCSNAAWPHFNIEITLVFPTELIFVVGLVVVLCCCYCCWLASADKRGRRRETRSPVAVRGRVRGMGQG